MIILIIKDAKLAQVVMLYRWTSKQKIYYLPPDWWNDNQNATELTNPLYVVVEGEVLFLLFLAVNIFFLCVVSCWVLHEDRPCITIDELLH